MKKIGALMMVSLVMLLTVACDPDEVFDEAQQLEIDLQLIDEYLDNNFLTNQVEIDQATQLRYIIFQDGTGDLARIGNSIQATYRGYLLDGTEFDSSDGNGPLPFVLGRGDVIPGWDIGFEKLRVGSIATLFLPSALGYGNRVNGDIPANSVLIFDVEVVDIR